MIMYAGTTFRDKSGAVIGAHQKIDRVARRNLAYILGRSRSHEFPSIREILHFEGNNGPDGIKRKSPSQDEPWHFIDPTKPDDRALVDMIREHSHNLAEALKNGNCERAAFEAAWMAHAITDGLTPAHHYPLSDKIEELWGKPKEERLTIRDKNIIKGANRRDTIVRNWEYWGTKGVFATHLLFELGVATSIKTTTFPTPILTEEWLAQQQNKTLEAVFREAVQEVYRLDMYHTYWRSGWNAKLARQTRTQLIPIIARTVAYAWHEAFWRAQDA